MKNLVEVVVVAVEVTIDLVRIDLTQLVVVVAKVARSSLTTTISQLYE